MKTICRCLNFNSLLKSKSKGEKPWFIIKIIVQILKQYQLKITISVCTFLEGYSKTVMLCLIYITNVYFLSSSLFISVWNLSHLIYELNIYLQNIIYRFLHCPMIVPHKKFFKEVNLSYTYLQNEKNQMKEQLLSDAVCHIWIIKTLGIVLNL